jgi:hypothetical protein
MSAYLTDVLITCKIIGENGVNDIAGRKCYGICLHTQSWNANRKLLLNYRFIFTAIFYYVTHLRIKVRKNNKILLLITYQLV